MKLKLKSTIIVATFMLMSTTVLSAQVINFSMSDEMAAKNTPEGWTEVDLPQNLPTFTEANTFYITSFGASTDATDNTKAIQAALDAAANAGGGMVVVPAGDWLFGRITVGSKTVLHLCANATLKLLAYSDQERCLRHCDRRRKCRYIHYRRSRCPLVGCGGE